MNDRHWVASWAASSQGPYPVGNALLQPDLRFAIPDAERGARDQTFRLIARPGIWGDTARLRFTNVFGLKPVAIGPAFLGLHLASAAIVPGTNRAVTFAGARTATIPPGSALWSDPIGLDFIADLSAAAGRRLAVSFSIAGESGPMTWHAKAMTTSYLSAPGQEPRGDDESEQAFTYSCSSWFFLDALEMAMPADACAIVALGDSIVEGTGSTMNGDDRWTDVLARRLHRQWGNRVAVINGGIGGNQMVGPATYDVLNPFRGGPSGASRLDRDVLGLSGVRVLIWSEGINDFSRNGNASFEAVRDGMVSAIARIRRLRPDIVVIGATITSSLGSINEAHGFPEEDAKRRAFNDFVLRSDLLDHVVDFDAATSDPETGKLRPEFVPSSTMGGPGDGLHPNRAGYLAMGAAVPLKSVGPP